MYFGIDCYKYQQISSFKIKVYSGALFGAHIENTDFNFLNIKCLQLGFEPQPGHQREQNPPNWWVFYFENNSSMLDII